MLAKRRTRIVLGTFLTLGLTAYVSFLWTGKRGFGWHEVARMRVQLLDEDTGMPIIRATARGLIDGQLDNFIQTVDWDASNDEGWVDLHMESHGWDYHGWQLFWLFEIGEPRPLYTIRFEHPRYAEKEFPTYKLFHNGKPTWYLAIAGQRLIYYERAVSLEKAD